MAVRRTLIFDLDGTLVDSCAICVEILQEMLVERGAEIAIDPVAARPWMSVGGASMVAALLGAACGNPDDEITDFRARYARKKTGRDSLFPQVEPGLRDLHNAGFTLAICSNKPQLLVDKVLEDTTLSALFSCVVGGRTGVPAKPAPDLLQAVLDDLQVGASECVFIGDSEIDHAIAEYFEIPFLFLTHGYALPEYKPDPARSYHRFDELAQSLLVTLHA